MSSTKSGKPAMAAAIILTILSIGHRMESADAFRTTSPLSHSLPCRNLLCGAPTAESRSLLRPGDFSPRHHSSNGVNIRLNVISEDKKNKGSENLFEPGNFPTIVIGDPPADDIYKQAIQRTLLWVGLAVAFGLGLGVAFGSTTSEEFFAGYLVEQSLSVDNLFVFLLLFEYFRVPLNCQDRVLNWGIYGAVVMRAVMIGLGAAALENFHAILLVFAGILVYSSAKTLIPGDEDEDEEDLSENSIVAFSRNLIESTDNYDGDRFFTIVDGIKKATPLFICMVALEISDVVFAVDSIPAVFGVTSVS